MKTSESITKIAAALLKAQSTMGNAVKGASNPYFKSSFADLNSVREAVTPALNANGITVLQPTTVVDGKAYVETILMHESGEFLSGLTEILSAKVNDPQAAGSGISYARRYGLQSFLSVGAVDDDSELAMGRGNKNVQSISVTTTTAENKPIEVKPSTGFSKPTKKAESAPVTTPQAQPQAKASKGAWS
jgi:cell division septation protein DedD